MKVLTAEDLKQKVERIKWELKIAGKKQTTRNVLIELLQKYWLSNYQVQQALCSSSADRELRFIRENPPQGMKIAQRKKELPDGYGNCLEYTLLPVNENGQIPLFF